MRFVKPVLIALHRWLGVVGCLLFLLWFPSGFVLMYWGYPSVEPADRLAHQPPLNAATIRFSALDAAAKAGVESPGSTRLTTFDGRPVYRFGARDDAVAVYADTGDEQAEISQPQVARIAASWSGEPLRAARVTVVERPDQWTLQIRFGEVRPLWKFSWPDGQQVYVSQRTGDVVQYTTTASRWAAYFGAIPHWLYFTPLRRNGALWSQVVKCASGIATVVALLGLVLGVWMYSPSKRYRYYGAPSAVPYRGWKHWHMIVGLTVGVGAVTWAFSGLLSMDTFTQATARDDGPLRTVQRALQPLGDPAPLQAFAAKDPRAALGQLPGLRVKELTLASILGQPAYIATIAPGDTRIVPVDGEPQAALDRRRLIDFVTRVSQPFGGARPRVISQYDRYYLDRHRKAPLPVVLVELNDTDRTRYYIDPKSALVVGSYSAPGFLDRWLYHGLHSLNFPWLYNHRPAWDIIVIAFMIGGTALSATSMALAWQVLGRTLRMMTR